MTDPTCLAAGCTHTPAPGARLCPRDVQRLGDWVAQIGAEYDRLTAIPSMQAPAAGNIHGGALKSHQSVGDLDVMVLRDRRSGARDDGDPDGNRGRGVLEVLGYWAAAVRQARRLTAPTRQIVIRLRGERPAGPLCEPMARAFRSQATPCGHASCRAAVVLHTLPAATTVTSERALLSTHLRWIVTTDAAGDFFDDVRQLWVLLGEANGTASRSPRVRCECGGTARWSDGVVRCGLCGTSSVGLDVLRRTAA